MGLISSLLVSFWYNWLLGFIWAASHQWKLCCKFKHCQRALLTAVCFQRALLPSANTQMDIMRRFRVGFLAHSNMHCWPLVGVSCVALAYKINDRAVMDYWGCIGISAICNAKLKSCIRGIIHSLHIECSINSRMMQQMWNYQSLIFTSRTWWKGEDTNYELQDVTPFNM